MENHEHVAETTKRSLRLVPCSSEVRDDPVFSDMLAIVTKKMVLAFGKVPEARGGDDAGRRQACLSFRLAEILTDQADEELYEVCWRPETPMRSYELLEEHCRLHWEEPLVHSWDTRTCRKERQS